MGEGDIALNSMLHPPIGASFPLKDYFGSTIILYPKTCDDVPELAGLGISAREIFRKYSLAEHCRVFRRNEAVEHVYVNSQEAQKYLVRGTPDYLGGFIHFYSQNEGMVPMDVKKVLTEGPQPMPQMEMAQNLDFAQYGQMLRMSEEGYRQQEILRIVRELPENSTIRRVLDVGCAAGLLGLAVIGDGENRSGVLLDQIPSQIIQSSVDAAGLGERVEIMQGNFLTDDLGGGYDLILAVSVMLFAKGDMASLMKKFFDALNPGGVLLVVSEGIAEDLSGPWDMMTGYLPYFLNGMDLAVRAGEVEAAARAAGFTKIESRTEQLCSGTQDILVIRK